MESISPKKVSEKQLFVSAGSESVPMFSNPVLDYFSRVRPWVPTVLYVPVIGLCLVVFAFKKGPWLAGLGIGLLGLVSWSFFEYALHRWVFHWQPQSAWGRRLHFIVHGVHHDYPNDALRLVMPPGFSLPLAILIFALCWWIWGPLWVFAYFPGFVLGYLVYDNLHFAVHHFNFKNVWFQKLKRHHMMHHYRDPERGFGFTSPFWDKVFGTDYET
ncbi:MAG: sterol desaturase family protein [Flavobacteriales bacterium]|nr:sterol desaturase family protein [Flavobacteriales bacterium]MDW8431752.1 sterol desaturase family protein [Flavobacteriales bacterium]